jgi:hypothetical protein
MNKQHGFSVAELGIVCVVVFVIGLLGYVFYDRLIDGASTTETAQTTTDAVPTIASTEDLTKAEAVLDDASLDDGTTLSQLDAELASFE